MTREEKLENFRKSAIEEATKKSEAILNEVESKYNEQFFEYKREATAKAEAKFKKEKRDLLRNKNQMISKETLDIKYKINDKTNELTDKIFEEVKEKLTQFKKQKEYVEFLKKQIKEVENYANDNDYVVYVDAEDSNLIPELTKVVNVKIEVAKDRIWGGIRAIIESRNILIDNSFVSKLADEKSKFKL